MTDNIKKSFQLLILKDLLQKGEIDQNLYSAAEKEINARVTKSTNTLAPDLSKQVI